MEIIDIKLWVMIQMVIDLAGVQNGESLIYRLPNGSPVNITRVGEEGATEDFLALSSTCPHLGCQVHWESQNNRFFCPCHNGVFSPDGVGIGGPPGDAGQSLPKYPLKVENNLLFIEVPLDQMAVPSRHLDPVPNVPFEHIVQHLNPLTVDEDPFFVHEKTAVLHPGIIQQIHGQPDLVAEEGGIRDEVVEGVIM